ncbi:hypothetical protein SD457_20960 [Coprobacillaceae bacterium CR2/5/TPMF4]|nr:hypothetical protein SD457_20960 [Coprobacillaceae bacterium CR2/5/TPMF4]
MENNLETWKKLYETTKIWSTKNLGYPLKAMTGFKLNLMIWNQSIVLLWEA